MNWEAYRHFIRTRTGQELAIARRQPCDESERPTELAYKRACAICNEAVKAYGDGFPDGYVNGEDGEVRIEWWGPDRCGCVVLVIAATLDGRAYVFSQPDPDVRGKMLPHDGKTLAAELRKVFRTADVTGA